jgi:coatomer protein complex subunit alpha (xenin)
VSHLKELLGICREYINAVRIKEALSDPDNDNVRVTELGAYFTHCNMEIAHLMLALDLAMTKSFKNKNYITAAAFARRLLELPDVSLEKNAKLRYVG